MYPTGSTDSLRASLTLETALLMPLIFAAIFSCVFLTFQYHNAAAMTANASETAITGKQQKLPSYAGAGTVVLNIDDQRKKRISSVSGHISSWLSPGGDMICTQTYRKVNPPRLLRRLQLLNTA